MALSAVNGEEINRAGLPSTPRWKLSPHKSDDDLHHPNPIQPKLGNPGVHPASWGRSSQGAFPVSYSPLCELSILLMMVLPLGR